MKYVILSFQSMKAKLYVILFVLMLSFFILLLFYGETARNHHFILSTIYLSAKEEGKAALTTGQWEEICQTFKEYQGRMEGSVYVDLTLCSEGKELKDIYSSLYYFQWDGRKEGKNTFSEKEYQSCAKIVKTNQKKEKLRIASTWFTAQHWDSPYNEIPITTVAANQLPVQNISLVCGCMSGKDYKKLANQIQETFPSYNFRADQIDQVLGLERQKTCLFLIAVLVSLFNIALIYQYIMQEQSPHIILYQLCGCRKHQLYFISLTQAILLFIIPFTAAAVGYFLLYPTMYQLGIVSLQSAMGFSYTGTACLFCGMVTVLFFLLCSAALVRKPVRESYVERNNLLLRFAKVLSALELAVVMAGIYFIADTYHFNMRDYDKIDKFPYTGIYFSTFHDHTDGSFLKIKEKIEKTSGFLRWSFTKQEVIEDTDAVISFDPLSSQLFSMEVQKGIWFDETSQKNGKIPCVIVDNGIGDTDIGDTITIGGKDYIITGTVSPEEGYFNIADSYGNADTYALSELKSGLFPTTYRIILCSTEDAPEYVDEGTSIIAYFDKTLSEKKMTKIRQILEEEGITETFEEMKQITYQQCYYKVMEYIPFCIIFLMISIMGIVTLTVTKSKQIIRRYGITALYGCRWGQVAAGYFGKLFSLAAFMSVLAAIFAYYANIYDRNIMLLNLFISLACAFLGTILLHLLKGRKDIMACIRC